MDAVVDTVIEDARWEILGLEALAERAVLAAFAELGLPPQDFALCVMGCDDARIAALNGDFRAKPLPTNVLSWPSQERAAKLAGEAPDAPMSSADDAPEELGDIAIAYETCQREAQAAAKPMADHVSHLLVHGFLHLLGYDHIREADAGLMEGTEVRILARLGLRDPYSH